MKAQWHMAAAAVALGAAGNSVQAQWVTFSNQTSTRLVASPTVGTTDGQEKDYAWEDFDQDGDTDLVVMRKTPFSVAGGQRNVLFMNEGIADGQAIDGVLVDRTLEYASASLSGGQGMLDATDDRDVTVSDVNGDGWLDLITATTYGTGQPKTISHPRIYINLGENGSGVWQGFRYEEARIPNLGAAPNFCAVTAGDVTGDKAPDLYFVDYDRVSTSPFDDILLVNDGNGFFTNQSNTRLTPAMLASEFGTACTITDMNGDGWNDIVKSENGPVKTIYNAGNGTFNALQATFSGSAYFSSVADLNQDGRMDIIISDDGSDRYMLNTGTSGGQATFSNLLFPNSGGFNSASHHADLNNDGFNDVVICDVDVDIPGCSRQMKLYRNLGNLPTVTMADQGSGGIPGATLTGTFDCAVLDINRDGWKDLVIGQCNATTVWINVPPSGLVFSYPQGLPGFVASNQPHNFQVQVAAVGGGSPVPGSGVLHYSVNGGATVDVPMSLISGNLYGAQLPGVNCTDSISFYVSAQLSSGGTFNDPSAAPASRYNAVAANGTEITLLDTIEGDVSGWTVTNHASLTSGAWVQADPNGTINGAALAAPEDDAGNGADIKAFVTTNGTAGGAANASDVDGGPTWLVSPVIDLAGTDATISYSRWFYSVTNDDVLVTEVSNNNGSSWTLVHTTNGTGSEWESVSFRAGAFVTPSAQVRVRFSTQDSPNNSVTEAGIDDFQVESLICGTPCIADIAPGGGNGQVDIDDLTLIILAWGTSDPVADINNDTTVNIDDLTAVVLAWGACP